ENEKILKNKQEQLSALEKEITAFDENVEIDEKVLEVIKAVIKYTASVNETLKHENLKQDEFIKDLAKTVLGELKL
ncbi:hypothetical protein MCHI_000133, partial [Candidatus Magnetoovum chiemensis]